MNPLITVIIPIYNAEKYLLNCIKSVSNQTYKNIQILLVNDGSTDNSGQICDEYQEIDIRVNVFHKENGGVSSARNFAISKAKGEYICFVDADDEIETPMLEELYACMISKNADLSICGHKSICMGKNGKIVACYHHVCTKFQGSIQQFLTVVDNFLASESIQGPCGKLFKTKIIKNKNILFPQELSFGEDTVFVYRYLHHCIRIGSTDQCLYFYMKRSINTLSTSFRADRMKIYLYLIGLLENLLHEYHIDKKHMIEKIICGAAISCIGELYNNRIRLISIKRRAIIKDVLLDERVLASFRQQPGNNIQNWLVTIFANLKWFGVIDRYFSIKEYARNNFTVVFTLLRKCTSSTNPPAPANFFDAKYIDE